jgi:WD40 repeat protein/uncharacterized caspase-like protein
MIKFALTTCLLLIGALGIFSFPRVASQTEKPELILQNGHSERSDGLAFSPDSKYLASASTDSTIRIWDSTTGNELLVLAGHASAVRTVTFSADGKLLASGGADGKVKIWDVATGRELANLAGHKGRVNAVAFSRDSKLLASGGVDNSIKIWDVSTQTNARTLDGHSGWVTSLVFSVNGQQLISGSADKSIKLWDIATGQATQTIAAHRESISNLALNANGDLLVSGGADSAVRVWQMSQLNTEPAFSFNFATGRIVALNFTADGQNILAASSERISQRFNLASRSAIQLSAEPDRLEKYEAAAFSPDGQSLALCVGTPEIEVHNLGNFNNVIKLDSRANPVRAVAFSEDGRWFATGNQDTSVTLWDAFAGRVIGNFAGNAGSVNAVAFSPDSQTLASGSRGGIIRLLDVVAGNETRRWQAHEDGINALLFSGDGKQLMTCSADQTIKIWDAATGNLLSTLKGHAREVNSLSLSADSKLLASGSADGIIKIWDTTNWRELRSLTAHSGAVFALAFSGGGKLLASGSADKTAKLWQTSDWQLAKTFNDTASIHSLNFSSDDKLLVTGNSQPVISLWDTSSGSLIRILAGASGSANSLNFNEDGSRVISAHEDGSLRIWNAAKGELMATAVSLRESSEWLVVTPEGLFDGSPDAWPQILWRFGKTTFNALPVEIFFNEFFYPDLLSDVLAGKQPKPKNEITQIDRRQPQVRLLANDTSNQQTITVKIEVAEAAAGSGAQDVRLFRNGALFKIWRGDVLKDQRSVVLQTELPIIAGENRLTAYAFNRDNVKSLDANRFITGAEALRRRGTLRIVAIGINQYSNANYNLRFAAADARDFMEELWKRQMQLNRFANVELITLYDDKATKAGILATLEKLKTAQPEDAVIVYFAGHGLAVEPRFYLIPHDIGYNGKREDLTQAALARVLKNSISDEDLIKQFEGVDAGQLLLVIDACNSGQALESDEARRGPMNSKGLAQLAYEKGIHVLTASQSYQAALENKELGHGYLTYALIESGLRKLEADNRPRNGQVVVREWLNYATDKVPRMQEAKYKDKAKETERILKRPNSARLTPKVKPEAQRPRAFYRRETEAQPMVITQTPQK